MQELPSSASVTDEHRTDTEAEANAAADEPASSRRAPQLEPRTVRQVVVGLILRGEEVLICQRRPDQPLASKWEFPGGKIEPGETAEQALRRELTEELGIEAIIGTRVAHVRHNYRSGGAVDLQFFLVRDYSGQIENLIF